MNVKVKKGKTLTVVRFARAHTAQSWHSAVWRAPTSLEQGHDHNHTDDDDDDYIQSHKDFDLMMGANDL